MTPLLHLPHEAGEMRGQRDSQPVSGTYPTTIRSPATNHPSHSLQPWSFECKGRSNLCEVVEIRKEHDTLASAEVVAAGSES